MKNPFLLFVLFALSATGLWAQPANPAFDVEVNGTYLAPNGQLPDAEVSLQYQPANVICIPQASSQPPAWSIYGFAVVGPPWPGVSFVPNAYPYQLQGVPSIAGTYTVEIITTWKYNNFTGIPFFVDGPAQSYTLEVRPQGYGVTYPPAPGGGSSASKSSGGSDSS